MSLDSRLLGFAKVIDSVDCVTGPLGSLCYYSGDEHLAFLGLAVNIAELALLKIPFMLTYVAKTGDLTSLLYWVPKEIFANVSKPGGFLDIVPTYLMRTEYVLSKKSSA